MLRTMPGAVVKNGRFFSTTANRSAVASIYDRILNWRKPKVEKELHDPSKDSKVQEDLPEDSKPRTLKMLGKPKDINADWDRVKAFAVFEAWPTRYHRSDLTAAQIDSAVAAAFAGVDFASVAQRFEATKKLARELQIAIPDAVLSKAASQQAVSEYLLSVARPYDEKTPDAVFLNPEDFAGTNITISDPVAERKERRQRYKQLLRDAKQAQDAKAAELLA